MIDRRGVGHFRSLVIGVCSVLSVGLEQVLFDLFLHLAGFLVFAQPLLLLVFPVAFLHLVRGNHVVRYMLDLGFRAAFQYFFNCCFGLSVRGPGR